MILFLEYYFCSSISPAAHEYEQRDGWNVYDGHFCTWEMAINFCSLPVLFSSWSFHNEHTWFYKHDNEGLEKNLIIGRAAFPLTFKIYPQNVYVLEPQSPWRWVISFKRCALLRPHPSGLGVDLMQANTMGSEPQMSHLSSPKSVNLICTPNQS